MNYTFSLKNKYTLDKPNNEIDFVKYIPTSLATMNKNSSIFSISFSRENAYVGLQNSYISIEIEVLKNYDTRYADGDEIALVTFGLVAPFSEAKLTTSWEKHIKQVDILHTKSLMNKLSTSQQQIIDLK